MHFRVIFLFCISLPHDCLSEHQSQLRLRYRFSCFSLAVKVAALFQPPPFSSSLVPWLQSCILLHDFWFHWEGRMLTPVTLPILAFAVSSCGSSSTYREDRRCGSQFGNALCDPALSQGCCSINGYVHMSPLQTTESRSLIDAIKLLRQYRRIVRSMSQRMSRNIDRIVAV